MPQEHTSTSSVFYLDPLTFTIHTPSLLKDCDIINEAVVRYTKFIIIENSTRVQPSVDEKQILKDVQLVINDTKCPQFPSLTDNENYTIEIDEDAKTTIQAESVWGVLKGLETFAQLVWQETPDSPFVVNGTTIKDFPRYKHRGLLLDTARHFQPISVIKKNLNAMEWNKMNVFHWHIVDDQSFPFESFRFPNLTTEGAYSPKHVYTQKEIRDVMDYARLRGIRVILEFDTPGHTMGFGKAFPELLTSCFGDGVTPGTPNYSIPHSDYELLDPTKNYTYWFMEEFFTEVRKVLQDEYVHLGMDEVYYGCWESSPLIKKFMNEHNYTKISDVEQHYVKRMLEIVERQKFKYITWQDPIENDVQMAANTIIHVWKDTELDTSMGKWEDYIKMVASKNYQIILSACWYLNYISYGQDWKKYYECDPKNFDGTEAEKNLVIGGEACLWGEYVDGTNLLSRLWPRASAVAERLWSAETVNNTDDAAYRLDEQRCRMLRRGIPTQPILNGYCGEYEWEMAPTIVSSTTTTVVVETSTSNINTEEPHTFSTISSETTSDVTDEVETSTSNINTEEPETISTIAFKTTSDDYEKPQESKNIGFQIFCKQCINFIISGRR